VWGWRPLQGPDKTTTNRPRNLPVSGPRDKHTRQQQIHARAQQPRHQHLVLALSKAPFRKTLFYNTWHNISSDTQTPIQDLQMLTNPEMPKHPKCGVKTDARSIKGGILVEMEPTRDKLKEKTKCMPTTIAGTAMQQTPSRPLPS
jgi:hypothetical protein